MEPLSRMWYWLIQLRHMELGKNNRTRHIFDLKHEESDECIYDRPVTWIELSIIIDLRFINRF